MEKFFVPVTFLSVLLLAFYWFAWRPANIRGQCDNEAWNSAESKTYDPYWKTWNSDIDQNSYNWKYNQCLHSKGINEIYVVP